MGLVPRADQAYHYVHLSQRAPQIVADPGDPAWVIELAGRFEQLLIGEAWTDPTCVVINGEPVLYATGPISDLSTGVTKRGTSTVSPGPDRALPPLAP